MAYQDGSSVGLDASFAGPDAAVRPDASTVGQDAGGWVYSDAGCLTFRSISQLCGYDSDESICRFSFSCNASSSVGQCQINCEMGSTLRCYGPTDIVCIQDAFAAEDCNAFKACGWVL
ncbi:MAG: hypothetical protein HY901_35040 [Deltaproteobacteria bacterium]|nr:hypothetical protein [Deltaproteobacteria bacterium]